MIWAKTDAGRHEIQVRTLVKERARRNLLLLIDGTKSEVLLLTNVSGVAAADFAALEALGLITSQGEAPSAAESSSAPPGPLAASGPPAAPPSASPYAASPSAAAQAPAAALPAFASSAGAPAAAERIARMRFTAALTQLISSELGLRGFVLTLAVEKAANLEELEGVAERALEQVRVRHGDAAAAAARQTLYGA